MINAKTIAKLQNAGSLSPDDFYRQVAATSEAKRANFTVEGSIAVVLGAFGFQFAGLVGLVALVSAPVAWIAFKLWDSHNGLSEVEVGNFQERLPDYERRMYELDCITVQSVPVSSEQQLTETTADRLVSVLNPCKSCLFIGASRSGKSLLATSTAIALKAKNPELELWVLSAKCEPAESGYWGKFVRLEFYDFLYGDDALKEQAIAAWITMLNDFKQLRKPSILVMDELSSIGVYCLSQPKGSPAESFWQSYLLYAAALSSMGASSKKALWGISPNGSMRSLGMTRSSAGAFVSVFNALFDNWNETVWRDAKNNGLAPQKLPTHNQYELAQSMGSSLLTGINGEWFPTAKLETPSPSSAITSQFHCSDYFGFSAFSEASEIASRADNLPSELRAIVEYAMKRNNWIKARDCQRNITGFSKYSASQIRGWFKQLQSQGVGSVDGSDETLSFRC